MKEIHFRLLRKLPDSNKIAVAGYQQWRKHGDEGIEPSRFVRLASKGTSSHLHKLKDIIGYNRAGLEGSSLSVHQLIDVYVHDKPKMYGMVPNLRTGELEPHPKSKEGGNQ